MKGLGGGGQNMSEIHMEYIQSECMAKIAIKVVNNVLIAGFPITYDFVSLLCLFGSITRFNICLSPYDTKRLQLVDRDFRFHGIAFGLKISKNTCVFFSKKNLFFITSFIKH